MSIDSFVSNILATNPLTIPFNEVFHTIRGSSPTNQQLSTKAIFSRNQVTVFYELPEVLTEDLPVPLLAGNEWIDNQLGVTFREETKLVNLKKGTKNFQVEWFFNADSALRNARGMIKANFYLKIQFPDPNIEELIARFLPALLQRIDERQLEMKLSRNY